MSFLLPLATYNAGVRQVSTNLDHLHFLRSDFMSYAPSDVGSLICSTYLCVDEYLNYLTDDLASCPVSTDGIGITKEQGTMLTMFQDKMNGLILELHNNGISFTEH